MTKISKEEVYKLAKAAHIEVADDEVGPLIERLEGVLSYASCLKDVAATCQEGTLPKQSNVLREDKEIDRCPQPFLALAPEREEDFFVVPVIVKQ